MLMINKIKNKSLRQNKRFMIICLIYIGIFFLGTGVSYAYYALIASNNSIAGTAGTAELSLEIVDQYPNNNDYLVPQLEKGLTTAISSDYGCVDDNKNTVCQVYSIKITNTGTATVKVNGTITFGNIDKMPNLKWRLIQNKNTYGNYSSHYASLDDARFDSDLTLRKGASKTYYMVIWIDEVDKNQPDTGKYNATINFSSSNGTGVTSTVGEFNYMKNISADTFRSDEYREKIKNVSFVDYIDTSNQVASWDLSELGDNSIVAWLSNNSSEGYYDLYIGSKEEIYAKDLSNFFLNMTMVDSISFDNLNTIQTVKMSQMFRDLGSSSNSFELDLGNKFNTVNVTDMASMFYNTGRNGSNFTLDLGDKFNTQNVTNTGMMFFWTGDNSEKFKLDLGDKFDTSNVTNMGMMFNGTGYRDKNFTLDLGDKFDTSNVTNMSMMFREVGKNSTIFTLDLGNKFDTNKVKDMWFMFYDVGAIASDFTLRLGDKFDTSKVMNMGSMFRGTGRGNSNFVLNLGDKFDTSSATNVDYMFAGTGSKNDKFILDLSRFNLNSVTSYNSFIDTNATTTIYVKSDTLKDWILDKNFTGVSSSNVIVKS